MVLLPEGENDHRNPFDGLLLGIGNGASDLDLTRH
jgi:hypothetical protein